MAKVVGNDFGASILQKSVNESMSKGNGGGRGSYRCRGGCNGKGGGFIRSGASRGQAATYPTHSHRSSSISQPNPDSRLARHGGGKWEGCVCCVGRYACGGRRHVAQPPTSLPTLRR